MLIQRIFSDICYSDIQYSLVYRSSQHACPERLKHFRKNCKYVDLHALLPGETDFCFCEREAIAPHTHKVSAVTVYRWNRHYPSDRKLDLDLSAYTLRETTEFAGSSHDMITKEVYVK